MSRPRTRGRVVALERIPEPDDVEKTSYLPIAPSVTVTAVFVPTSRLCMLTVSNSYGQKDRVMESRRRSSSSEQLVFHFYRMHVEPLADPPQTLLSVWNFDHSEDRVAYENLAFHKTKSECVFDSVR